MFHGCQESSSMKSNISWETPLWHYDYDGTETSQENNVQNSLLRLILSNTIMIKPRIKLIFISYEIHVIYIYDQINVSISRL